MKAFLTYFPACLITAVLLSCAGNGSEIVTADKGAGTKMIDGNILKSTVNRENASAPAEDIALVAEANNEFAWAMFNELFSKDNNLVFSPYSISTALSMAWVGARGETSVEMQQALRFPFGGARFHAAMNSIDLQLKSRGQGSTGKDEGGFSLKVNNALWGEQTMQFFIHFLDTLACYYDAGMGLCDFINNPDPARLKINSWISDQTGGKISELLGPGSIGALTRLVITNTIYFDAAWADTFQPGRTKQRSFYPTESDSMKAWFMEREGKYNYFEDESFQAIEIPYSGNQVSMIMLLPKNKQFLPSETFINNDIVKALLAGLTSKKTYVRIPKFSFTIGSISIKQRLIDLGMRLAFTGMADFSGICDYPLFITDVFHNAFIAVDEKGTTAAAGTAAIITTGISDGVFFADHPFIFLIRDVTANQALFIGYVSEPAAVEQ